MWVKQVAFLFIGQTLRPDTMEEMRRYLPDLQIREYGALDGVSEAEITSEYAPKSHQDLLISKLQNGRSVQISEEMLGGRLQLKLEQAVADGAQLCVLMCTGSFPGLRCQVPLLTMDEVLHRNVEFPTDIKTIGLIVPKEEQQVQFATQYAHFKKEVLTAAASPYGLTETIVKEALKLKAMGAECICLDCMGYTDIQAQEVAVNTHLPVHTPRRETANQILKIAVK